MPLGGKSQTILQVTFNSKIYKTYFYLKVIFSVFYITTQNFLHVNISYSLYNYVQLILIHVFKFSCIC